MPAVVQMISVVNLSYKQLFYQINKQNYVSKNSHSKVIRERQCIFPDQKIKIFSLIKRMVSGRTYHLIPIAQMRPRLHNGKPLVMNHSQAVLLTLLLKAILVIASSQTVQMEALIRIMAHIILSLLPKKHQHTITFIIVKHSTYLLVM